MHDAQRFAAPRGNAVLLRLPSGNDFGSKSRLAALLNQHRCANSKIAAPRKLPAHPQHRLSAAPASFTPDGLLAGSDFTSNWNGMSVGDLFEKIRCHAGGPSGSIDQGPERRNPRVYSQVQQISGRTRNSRPARTLCATFDSNRLRRVSNPARQADRRSLPGDQSSNADRPSPSHSLAAMVRPLRSTDVLLDVVVRRATRSMVKSVPMTICRRDTTPRTTLY